MIIFHLQWCGFVSGNHSEVVFSLRSFCFSLAGFAALSTCLFFWVRGGIHRFIGNFFFFALLSSVQTLPVRVISLHVVVTFYFE